MTRTLSLALLLTPLFALIGCDGGTSGPVAANKVELSAEQAAEIAANDAAVADEEQGQKLVNPKKGSKKK